MDVEVEFGDVDADVGCHDDVFSVWFLWYVFPSTCDTNSEVQATVQDRNMRRGRIELTHELGGSSPERSSPPAAYFIWGARAPQIKTVGWDEPNSTVKIKIQVIDYKYHRPERAF
jgi:hypothetical protein